MIADTEETKEKLIVFFLEPENGVWNTDEAYGKPDGDVAYIEQVYLAGAQRFKFCVHEAKFYLTGCREGGVMANMAAMYNPAVWAGVVSSVLTVSPCTEHSEYVSVFRSYTSR